MGEIEYTEQMQNDKALSLLSLTQGHGRGKLVSRYGTVQETEKNYLNVRM